MNRFAALRAGVVYAISSVLQRTISIILLPVYIRTIAPPEYGQLSLVMSVAAACVALVSFGLESVIVRQYFRLAEPPGERGVFLSTVGVFLFAAPIGLVATATAVRWWLVPAPIAHDLLTVGLLGAAAQVSATVFPLSVLRAEERTGPYVAITLQYSLVMAVLLLLLVVLRGAGAAGWLWANALAWMSVLPYGVLVLRRYWTPVLSGPHLRVALLAGLPLVPHALAHWGLSVSDRIILSAFVTQEEVGIYGLGYQAGALMGVLVTAMNWALMPRYARLAAHEVSGTAPLSSTIALQVAATGFVGLGAALIAPEALRIAVPSAYGASASIVPWVVLGYCFTGLYYIPMNTLTLTLGETRWVWLATVLAAATNIGCNLALIPRMGIEAAAINSAVGYGVLFVAVLVYAARRGIWPSGLGRRILQTAAIVLPIYAFAQITSPEGTLGGTLVRACWITASVPPLAAVTYRRHLHTKVGGWWA